MVETLSDPTLRSALAAFAGARERGDLVTLFGRCSVDYDGRATSTLAPGARLLMCKPDGATLVHDDEGQSPVNWLPPGAAVDAGVKAGTLRVVATRSTPAERLLVSFDRVAHLAAYPVDRVALDLSGSEADLRASLVADPERIEPELAVVEAERATDAGSMDLFCRDGEDRPVVVELKRRRVGPDAAGQLGRYVDAVRRELGGDEVRGVLVAPSVTDRAADLLEELGLSLVALGPATGRSPE